MICGIPGFLRLLKLPLWKYKENSRGSFITLETIPGIHHVNLFTFITPGITLISLEISLYWRVIPGMKVDNKLTWGFPKEITVSNFQMYLVDDVQSLNPLIALVGHHLQDLEVETKLFLEVGNPFNNLLFLLEVLNGGQVWKDKESVHH